MKPRIRYIAIALVLATFVGGYVLSRSRPNQIPAAEDVTVMTASLFNRPDSGTDIPEFLIPKSHYANILSLFSDAEPDSSPAKWQVLGSVEIESKHRAMSISLFWTGATSGAFRTSERRYFRGSSDSAIIHAIENAKADAK